MMATAVLGYPSHQSREQGYPLGNRHALNTCCDVHQIEVSYQRIAAANSGVFELFEEGVHRKEEIGRLDTGVDVSAHGNDLATREGIRQQPFRQARVFRFRELHEADANLVPDGLVW